MLTKKLKQVRKKAKADVRAIKRWMVRHVLDHINPLTNEVNLTTLVEDWDRSESTAQATLGPNHIAWDIAVEVSEMTPNQERMALRSK